MSNETMKVIDQHESTREALIEKAKIIRMHTSQEVAGALGGTDGITSKIEKFSDQQQSSGSVAISGESQQQAQEKIEQEGKEYQGMFHTHIESLGHAHEPSDQDKETFKKHEVNEIAFLREDGSIDIKAYNKNGEEIKQRIGGELADVLTLSPDDQISTQKKAA